MKTEHKQISVLSLGAGVQSSTLALMAAHGELDPMPECAIFADTGAEPGPVYQWLETLRAMVPFPIHIVMWKDGLLAHLKAAIQGGKFAGAPFYTENEGYNAGDVGGMLRRQCTREFKIQPITLKLRELIGLEKGERAGREVRAVQYIGISLDEKQRMKEPQEKWLRHRWPLIEKRMTRWDCMLWLDRHGYPQPPKSACTFCPYRGNHEWRWLKENDPEGWAQAVEVDKMVRGGVRGTRFSLYVHRDMVPLDEVDLSTDLDRGQLSLFNRECEGMCGV